jgi:6-pyruvoyltetrahydropterin/6-carboxytetrahydropterin synthase
MLEITKTFHFESAHFQPGAPAGHPNGRVHGHSYFCDVALAGKADPVTGMIRNLDDVDVALAGVRSQLDHHMLNEVAGLDLPTMERICLWIYERLKADLPELAAVTLRRPSLGQSCTYRSA